MSTQQNFRFTWIADGSDHLASIPANTYAEACWILGQRMAAGFLKGGVPNDFLLTLDDEQARLGETSVKSRITRGAF